MEEHEGIFRQALYKVSQGTLPVFYGKGGRSSLRMAYAQR